jgi:hypothetical protein
MTLELGIILLLFAVTGYAGTGVALAVARGRIQGAGEHDIGMIGVGILLFGFATLCAGVLSGLGGICALGAPITWASYLFAARRLGLFAVGAGAIDTVPAEEPRPTT